MAPFLEKAMDRVPITHEVGIRTFFCGPESFTPDLAPAVGEAPGIRGYFVAAGMNSVGVLSAGGLGRVLAEWIMTGRPDVDVTGFDVDRFRPDQLDADVPRHPDRPRSSAPSTPRTRPASSCAPRADAILSPVHQRLAEQGGYLREVSGLGGRRLVRRVRRRTPRRADVGARARGSRRGARSTAPCARASG